MSFHGNKTSSDVIEQLHQVQTNKSKNGEIEPILLGRTILEYVDEDARLKSVSKREKVLMSPTSARDLVKGLEKRDFEPHNPPIRWRKSMFPLTYHVDPSYCLTVTDKNLVVDAIDKAFNTFNFAYREVSKNPSAIMFKRIEDEVVANIKVRWQNMDGHKQLKIIGRCHYNWYTPDSNEPDGYGKLWNASINFDVADKWFISRIERIGYYGIYFDIQSFATHQIGHVIGLAHNSRDPYSVMKPTSKTGETINRTLGESDIQHIRKLYS